MKKKLAKVKPVMKWQTGAYSRIAEFRIALPYPFLLLCKLVETTPEQMIMDFTENLSCGSWKREGREEAKKKLIDYFVANGYGKDNYSEEERRMIFAEMDAMGLLFPDKSKEKLLNLYSEWRKEHHKYFFKKWYRKKRN